MKKILTKFGIVAGSALPFVAFAAEATQNLLNIVRDIGQIVSTLIPIVFTLAILVFFWGLVRYIFAAGSEEAQSNAKDLMIWAVVALFLMVSVFGIIKLFQRTLGVDESGAGTVQLPTVVRPNI